MFLPSLGRAKPHTITAPQTKDAPLSFGVIRTGAGQPYQSEWQVDRAVRDGHQRVVWVFRCVHTIASNQANLPMVMRLGDPNTGAETGDPILELLNRRANVGQDAWTFRYMLSAQLLLNSMGAFVEVLPARNGQPAALYLLPPGSTKPIPDPNNFVAGYEVTMANGDRKIVAPETVRWVKAPHPLNPYEGQTPLQSAGLAIDTDYYSRLFNRNFLLNDGRPGGVLVIKDDIDDADAEEMRMRFSGRGNAVSNAGRVSVISAEGGADFVDTATTPRDLQYVEGRKATKEEILIAFGVPETMLGNAAGRTFDNSREERRFFWMETMRTHCGQIARSLDTPGDNRWLGYDFTSVDVIADARIDHDSFLLQEVAAGVISVDEYRADTGRVGPGPEPISFLTPRVASSSGIDTTKAAQLSLLDSPPETPVPAASEQWRAIKEGKQVIDAKRAREYGATTRRRLTAWESTVRQIMRQYFERQGAVVVNKLTGTKLAGRWTATKQLDPSSFFDQALWARQLRADADAYVTAIMRDFGDDTAKRLGVTWNLQDPKVTEAILNQVNRIASVNQTTYDELTAALAEGEAEGESISELAARVRSVFEYASSTRAETIARTEVISAANYGSFEAASQSGVVENKVWLATGDERTRDAHSDADGQAVPLEEQFDIDGEGLDYPGDPAGSPENVINCRCTMIYETGPIDAGNL